MSFGGGGSSKPKVAAPTLTSAQTPPAATPATPLPTQDIGSGTAVVGASMLGQRENKTPSISKSFNTLVGEAGGIGRKPQHAKRRLIGGI